MAVGNLLDGVSSLILLADGNTLATTIHNGAGQSLPLPRKVLQFCPDLGGVSAQAEQGNPVVSRLVSVGS